MPTQQRPALMQNERHTRSHMRDLQRLRRATLLLLHVKRMLRMLLLLGVILFHG